jgi:hypothetical protein
MIRDIYLLLIYLKITPLVLLKSYYIKYIFTVVMKCRELECKRGIEFRIYFKTVQGSAHIHSS